MKTRLEQLLELARAKGIVRSADLAEAGLSRQYLSIACRQGLLERIGRGLYRLPGAVLNEHQSLIEVCAAVPTGVICLLSALRFHEMTTQAPFEVHLAIAPSAWSPRHKGVQIRLYRFSGPALTEGIRQHTIEGAAIRVYDPAKTVADCFKFRNKIGLDVAIEALRDCLRQRKATVDDLVRYGRVCRVDRVMAPYMEAML